MEKTVRVCASPIPFSNYQICFDVPEGTNVQEIVNQVIPARYKDISGLTSYVFIDGHQVWPHKWDRIKPKADTLVTVRIVPGKGGGKNPLTAILSIAVMLAAPYLATAVLGPTLAGAQIGIGAITYGQVVGGVFSLVGKMLISALAPPPKPSSAGRVNNPVESPTQFIEGAKNSINPFGVIPVCLGTNRMFPLQAARPYTETQDDDQYVRQLFTYGYGDELSITDIKIGETPIAQFTGVQMSHRLAGDLHLGTGIYSSDVYQEDVSVLLTNALGFVTRTTQENVDEAIVDVTWPSGLAVFRDSGARQPFRVQLDMDYSPAGAGTWTPVLALYDVRANQTEALRRSFRIIFPSNGTYDIRVRRASVDVNNDRILHNTYLTAIKSVKHTAPVTLQGINGTGVRIKATDQLNGALEQFNAVVSNHILDYDAGSSPAWVRRATSNPASIYRYVRQGGAGARPLADSKLILADLEAWHTYCESKGLTYNRVIDYETSVDEVIRDICAAGNASPARVDGKYTIVIDNEKEIKGVILARNTSNFKGEILYPDIPHALRTQFRNKEVGYSQDERIVYADGYDENNATQFEGLELQSCTDSDLAFKTARRHFANAVLQPEKFTFTQDIEHINYLRGDRLIMVHDIPLIGIGDGRIKSLILDDNSPQNITGFTIDDTIGIPTVDTYYCRIVRFDGTFFYKQLLTAVGDTSTLTLAEPIPYDEWDFTEDDEENLIPDLGQLIYVSISGGEMDILITRIEPQSDLSAQITALPYSPERFSAPDAAIPAWQSKVTIPLEFIRPSAPVLLGAQSDQLAMLVNSDGTLTPRAIFTLQNNNGSTITEVSVKIRISGTEFFTTPNVLEATPERVILTGLLDGTLYDIHIRYRRAGNSIYSPALEINNYLFEGASGVPLDVENFRIAVTGESAVLEWNVNITDIDISHYVIRYSSVYSGATWETAQLLRDNIYENRLPITFQGGTYLIKAVDLSGNESENAAEIITYDPGVIGNTIIDLTQAHTFPGLKDNVTVSGGMLILDDLTQDGYYYTDWFDLGEKFNAVKLRAAVVAGGTLVTGYSDNDVFTMDDIFTVSDLFGLSEGSWFIQLQMQFTDDDPASSPEPVQTEWQEYQAGYHSFRAVRHRLLLRSLEQNISPAVSVLTPSLDAPPRIESGEDLTVLDTGTTITYPKAFKAPPSVQITLQGAASGDRIDFTAKDETGFSFTVYNSSGVAVERTYDYIASGYGRVN